MRRSTFGSLLGLPLALAAGALLTACFVEPRPASEIFDVPFLSDEYCPPDLEVGVCHDGDPCTRDTCTAWQLCIHQPDDSLVPDDGQGCTIDTCSDGIARHEPAPAGTPCGANGALQCDGKGACVGCGADPLLCGEPTSCLGWACQADACAPAPAPAGLSLPLPEQVPGDCGVRQCDGRGGFESIPWADSPVDPWNPCYETDCFSGAWTARPVGSPCGGTCGSSLPGFGSVNLRVCDEVGECVVGGNALCAIGYLCVNDACRTECTPQTESENCVFGAECVDGRCVTGQGELADCQATCAKRDELGCPVDSPTTPCDHACLDLVHDAEPGCIELAQGFVNCLGAAAEVVTTCAEHRSACSKEYELYAECEGTDVPDGAGCSLLPCTTGFDGCSCAAVCDDTTVADHCVPDAAGTFTCTCAVDGVTVATCEGAAGCGIEKGCCKGAL